MGVAFVTGPSDTQAEVSAALLAAGIRTINPTEAGSSKPVIDCYVQLAVAPGEDGARAAQLVDRVAEVDQMARQLAEGATVVLVTPDWDWRERSALRLLAEATLANGPATGASVVVLESAAAVAPTVTGGAPLPPTLADLDPQRGYADWREDMLSLSDETERTYFGWRGADGQPRVAVLAGAVMSPVRAPGAGGVLVWGAGGNGAEVLAGALLADTLGPDCLCPGCLGALPACADCDSTGLAAAIRQLAVAFAGEVVRTLPVGGFELRVGDVVEWARRQSAVSPVPDVVRRPPLHATVDVRRLEPTLM